MTDCHDIIINGQTQDIREFKNQVNPGSIDRELYNFLLDWFSESSAIPVQTSGSTGEPKLLTVEKKAMIKSALRTADFFNLKPGMTVLLCLPVSFIAGKMMVIRAIVSKLNLLTVTPSAQPLKNINKPIDFAAFTPMQMLNELTTSDKKINFLRKVIIGGGKVDQELDNLLQKHPFEAWETYGMTETLTHIALRRINGHDKQKVFYPLNNVLIGTDDRGCLTIKDSHITDKTIVTNDLAIIYPDGSFSVTGRADNIINSGGIKVSPEKTEGKILHLLKIPFVISSVPHPVLGQQAVLVTEGIPNYPQQLFLEISKCVAKYEMPASLYVLEKFPVTDSGKYKRQEIKRLMQSKQAYYSAKLQ